MEGWRSRVIGAAGALAVGVAVSSCLDARCTRRRLSTGRRALQVELVRDATVDVNGPVNGPVNVTATHEKRSPLCSPTVVVPAEVEDALLRQWRIVYGNGCPEEADLERGGRSRQLSTYHTFAHQHNPPHGHRLPRPAATRHFPALPPSLPHHFHYTPSFPPTRPPAHKVWCSLTARSIPARFASTPSQTPP